ncbi:carboxypeptidase-like regulatory domain-containing protein [Tenacibaculum discolor]|uniref:carboxypeptidase-like regulatory domain-containing protein n=1 Tax=Tenacibaculum discolor TaxID=361581 RepID=UPI000EB1E976|nr:carboxypeptidase-like regulatory domain-containing protein [Tenacibaculum discolor]RLK02890.1 TonB-dependent receptor-like protein [Tenacibaculum discolor]
MRNFTITMLLLFSGLFGLNAQNIVKGIVINGDSENPMQGVSVSVKEANVTSTTDASGAFTLNGLPNGRQIVTVSLNGYETQNFPVELSGKTVDLGTIFMYEDLSEDQDLSTITITDDELSGDTSASDNISGLLQATRDVYLRTAAFEWSSSFYRVRGLDSENGKVLLNGIEMNKLYNGRPQWSNWGGLNDVLRNQEFSNGLAPSNYTFGGVLGSTNISTRASEYSEGGRISYASSNRSYNHRLMATYASGLLENGWAIAASGSKRYADEGYTDGTNYNAHSIFFSIEKKLSDKHSLNFTSIYAQNRRGKSSSNTEEVFDLKGRKYNSYWGYQNGDMRNSRIKRVEEPIIMLSHYWNLSDNTTLNTNIGYQFGEIGNSRLDYGGHKLDGIDANTGNPYIVSLGGSNPSADYYQKLPSYAIRQGNPYVYEVQQGFINNGQINWDNLYKANRKETNNGYSSYILYEDRNDDKQLNINSILNSQLNDNITLNAKVQYSRLNSENFAYMLDLLGGQQFLDVDGFADIDSERQNDLQNPYRTVTTGDRFKYNYKLNSEVLNGFVQAQFKYNKVDFYLAADINKTTHQREGLYQNGAFPTISLGKSDKIDFTSFSGKAGFTYKISGRHLLDFNGGYITKAPLIRNVFYNARETNNIVDNLKTEKILTADASYILRTPFITSKLTGYYTQIKDATEVSFFFAQGLELEALFQETMTGVNKQHIGAEFGIEAQVTPTIKLKGAANYGQYTYTNNPNVKLNTDVSASTDFQSSGFDPVTGLKDYGVSNLKNYKVAAGPQTTYSIGFEYRDPDYWWVGATMNFFDNIYVDVSPLLRTSSFTQDSNGITFNDYNPAIARELLKQEKFNNYNTVNLIGGKSWKIANNKFISVFASVNNLFDTVYRTGGYEASRNANYRALRDDKALETPVFGNKYWYGRGTTYFLNVNYRF